TNGDSVGNGFTIIGGITVLAALLTVGFLRSGRNTRHRARAITLGFAGFGTVSLALTYILALTSHRTAHGSPTQIVAGDVVQALSSIITLAMACAIVHCIWRSAAPLRRTTR
ncbi:MAG: hypothetical protein J2P17_23830, partial [Mycobacterium sp.]|nr:hypothetical protein [Mycobacterium sp.]